MNHLFQEDVCCKKVGLQHLRVSEPMWGPIVFKGVRKCFDPNLNRAIIFRLQKNFSTSYKPDQNNIVQREFY